MVIVIVLLAVAPTHQSASFVFGKFYGVSEVASGITNNGYAQRKLWLFAISVIIKSCRWHEITMSMRFGSFV